MYDLGGSWYITGEFDNIEANIITKEMLTKKILNKSLTILLKQFLTSKNSQKN